MISATRVHAIAANTLREAVRNRVLYALLFFGVMLIGIGILVSSLSYVEAGFSKICAPVPKNGWNV